MFDHGFLDNKVYERAQKDVVINIDRDLSSSQSTEGDHFENLDGARLFGNLEKLKSKD